MKRAGLVARQGEAGFSLIEVLVSLTILCGLMAVFTPLAGRMISTWARDADRAGRADMLAAAIDRLSRDLAVALPAIAEGSDPPQMQFRGTSTGFSMVGATGGMPELVTVASAAGTSGNPALVRSSRLWGSSDPSLGAEARVALLDHPISARFAYRSSAGGDSTEWHDKAEMPEAVIVTFMRGKETLLGGPVILPVHATLPVGCVATQEFAGKACRETAGEANSADGQGPGEQRSGGAGSGQPRGGF